MTRKEIVEKALTGKTFKKGRPRLMTDGKPRNIRVPDATWARIPQPKSPWVRDAIDKKLEVTNDRVKS